MRPNARNLSDAGIEWLFGRAAGHRRKARTTLRSQAEPIPPARDLVTRNMFLLGVTGHVDEVHLRAGSYFRCSRLFRTSMRPHSFQG